MKLYAKTICLNGVEIKYWIREGGGRRTVLLLHGFKGNHKGLTELSQEFADCRVIVPDLPGHGQSDSLTVKHTPLHFAQFVEHFCIALDLHRVDLVGHSYGATVALLYASLYGRRLKSLVLISPTIPDKSWSGQLAQWQVTISKRLPRAWRKAWMGQPLLEVISSQMLIKTVSRRRKLELMKAGMRNTAEIRPDVIIEALEGFLRTPYYAYASQIVVPSLILAGQEDEIASLDSQVELGQQIMDCRFYMLGKVGHLAPLEMPGTVASVIKEFWKDQR